ncbi:MAG: hypothetical protein HY370_02910 [Proteobacteria bacterium]|nr:hypothetical protein [Pseudomonadota bacterium]
MATIENLVVFLYALAPLSSSIAYLPQIRKILRAAPHEVRGISIQAWSLWLCNALIAVFYGVLRIHDPLFITVSTVSALWCALLIGLTLWKQAQKPHACAEINK